MTLGEVWTGAGYLTGIGVFIWMARRHRIATPHMGLVAGWGLAAAVVGAKLAQLVSQGWPFKLPFWTVAEPETGGRALRGGLLAGWLGVEIAKRRLGIKGSTGDLFAPALAAGEAVGRIGCFFNGCCYGSRCDLPWAVFQHGAWRHPAQIYSSITAAAMFGVLMWIELSPKRLLPRQGDLFRLYLLLFGATRFALEFVRWRETLLWGLSPMQWFCVELILYAAIGLGTSFRAQLS